MIIKCMNISIEHTRRTIIFYSEIWISEVEIWRRRLVGKNIRNTLDALNICNADAFQNIHKMLRVMSILPVTTSNERSFSTLRRLKTYLRSTMGEDRLNWLASLNIHRDINVDINQALNLDWINSFLSLVE